MSNKKLLKKSIKFFSLFSIIGGVVASSCGVNDKGVVSPFVDITKSFNIKDASGLKDLTVNYDTWMQALDSFGASADHPFIANYKSIDASYVTSQNDYWNNLALALKSLSQNKIRFSFNNPTSANISNTDWNPDGNSTLGSLRWATTYQHIAPYLEVYFWTQYFNNSIKPLYDFLTLIHKNQEQYIQAKGQYFVDVANDLIQFLLDQKVFKNFDGDFVNAKQDNKDIFDFNNNNFGLMLTNWQFLSTDQIPSEERSKFIIDFLDSRMMILPTYSIGREETNRFLLKDNWGYVPSLQFRDMIAPDNESTLTTSITFNPFVSEGRWAPLNEQLFTVNEFGFDTTLSGLTTIQYKGQETTTSNSEQVITLELAKKISLYDKDNKLLSVLLRKDQDVNALSEQEKQVLYPYENIDISEPKLNYAVFNATRYEFDIDTNFKWKNANGEGLWNLSSKDWERGIEIYDLSSRIGINPNSTYLVQANIDLDKTVGIDHQEINNPNYDIGDFRQKDDAKLNLYLKHPYFNLLIFISNNGAFRPKPHLANSIKNLRLSTQKDGNNQTQGKIVLNNNNKVDITRTDITNIFGGYSNRKTNPNQAVLANTYFLGPYYLNSITPNTIIFNRNDQYFELLEPVLINKKRAKRIVQQYGRSDLAAQVQQFTSVSGLTFLDVNGLNIQALDDPSIKHYVKNFKVGKAKVINHSVWSGVPYVNHMVQSHIGDVAARFLSDFDSDNARIFRAGLIGFINWRRLTRLIQPAANFYYSVAPYGVFNYKGTEWYESISKGERDGSLVIPLRDYGYIYTPATQH
ncbi:MG321/MPN456 family lipoprotein [Mycoplasma sp. E35C]|uniref:MG321/MPN456 family lipoprotein n=1 Tax=Mycoplasma sp. E35C TaxID=2801918 RepID=UPI001CA42648|nr:MG321/MPN456 family lipoprotein [Mycoplasma sp. E35C]QZX48956.1 hypothetical protein JJE79_02775 [Mycoplasma sp. E35C]